MCKPTWSYAACNWRHPLARELLKFNHNEFDGWSRIWQLQLQGVDAWRLGIRFQSTQLSITWPINWHHLRTFVPESQWMWFTSRRSSKETGHTYYPESVEANRLKMLHDQLLPDVASPRQEEVWKYGFALRPNLHINTNIRYNFFLLIKRKRQRRSWNR